MRIDSSGNLLVGGTSLGENGAVTMAGDGRIYAIRASDTAGFFGRTSTDGSIVNFSKDGTTVGTIGTYGGATYYTGPNSGIMFNGVHIEPTTGTGSTRADNTNSIGSSSYRFKDLYLSGGVYLGGTGSANHLDDYEEGTWTASISAPVNMSGVTWNSGSYTKIGNLVTVQGSLSCTITSSNTLTYVSLILPFASGTQTGVAFANNNIKVGVCDLDSSNGGRIIPFFPAASAIVAGSEIIQVAATYITTT